MKKKERIGVYPGTFDPITYGHIDVVRKSLSILDRVVIAVASDTPKRCIFTPEERRKMIQGIFKADARVSVEIFPGLLVDFLRERQLKIIIRGLRAVSDFEYEFQMATTNQVMFPSVETIFFVPRAEFFYMSSSLVKEIARLGGTVSAFVPDSVERALKLKYSQTK
ncbi:MAG: pantetheine-phosphate adenylyltransferase [Candidatus Omnitrophica bacterium]|nr:pantetheine-phosphate adenylyltransferase [Candidatus Omnitrophota bacterium]